MGGCLWMLAILPVMTIVRGYVLMLLWAWFLVPLGLPAIHIAWALGISTTIGMLTHQYQENDEKEGVTNTERAIKFTFSGLGYPLVALAFGRLFSYWM